MEGMPISIDFSNHTDILKFASENHAVTFVLFAKHGPEKIWLKFHSKYAKNKKFEPLLHVGVKGQGKESEHIIKL